MEKKYKLEITLQEDGNLNINSENDGFTAFELLGFFTLKQDDILKQIKGEIKPDCISRVFVKD